MHLYEALARNVTAWRESHYEHEEYPAIAEILEWVRNPDVPLFRLRPPQIRALETYWYLRIAEGTPHIFELYTNLFPKVTERLDALDLTHVDMCELALDIGFDGVIEKVRDDNDFVKKYKLEALRETLTLDYPSYILALAMGPGKTVLIGAIFATEFAMAQEYPDNDFVENALVFAPGKTIIKSLRELAEIKYEAVLPPRMYKSFVATLKLMFTRDGDPDIPVTRGSSWNVIVTNTEKEDEARAEVANLRLQAIASLPKLAIFSDEAYHTYGQSMDKDLKKVRKRVDYLHNPHEPAKAKVSFKRVKDNVEITIDDFISLTILERLSQQNKGNPLFSPQVSDWRSMADSVMIDANYDGEVFNVTLADVPEKKNDLVEGKYTVEAKKGATVAVKMTDMLGEEVLEVK